MDVIANVMHHIQLIIHILIIAFIYCHNVIILPKMTSHVFGGGRVVRRCWVNFQCWGVLLIWIRVGQGPVALAVGAGGGCLDIFSLVCPFSPLSPSLWETARYRLKYCLKGPLNPKQPTNQPHVFICCVCRMMMWCQKSRKVSMWHVERAGLIT